MSANHEQQANSGLTADRGANPSVEPSAGRSRQEREEDTAVKALNGMINRRDEGGPNQC